MDAAELTGPLAQCRLFENLGPSELQAVLQSARQRQVEPEAFFFQQGDPADALYVLVQGRVKLAQVTSEGYQVLLNFAGPGEMFGGIAALGDAAYPVSAQAVDRCRALAWDGGMMVRLMEHTPRLALNALSLAAGRIQELQDRLRELATERVERRVARVLLRLVRQAGRKVEGGVLVDMPLSRQDLAEMTGTTLYTVSRILSGWQQQGLVEARRERVLIRVPHGLVVIAEDLPSGSSRPGY